MAVRETESPVENARTAHSTPRVSLPILKQPKFNWKAPVKYHELNNFEIEVRNIFVANSYNIKESKKVPNTNKLARM